MGTLSFYREVYSREYRSGILSFEVFLSRAKTPFERHN